MKHNVKDLQRTEAFLKRQGLLLTDVTGFRFMQRHIVEPRRHSTANLYGPGVLTLCLQSGAEKAFILHVRQHPSSLIRGLVTAGIPFLNLHTVPRNPTVAQPTRSYQRTSLYMIWQFVLFLVCLSFGFYFTAQTGHSYRTFLALPFFAGGLYALYLLQARFCHVRLDEEALTLYSVGRSTRYPYTELLKVNFDFAREPNATHIMELLDTDYRYRLFYIGRTPRRSLQEITRRLREAGVDATCSLNDEKKHYHDVYHAQ